MRIIDITGQRYGRLTVLEIAGKCPHNRSVIWLTRCDCGTLKEVSRKNLTLGMTKSCGCLRIDRARAQVPMATAARWKR